MRVYVSGPISAETDEKILENVNIALDISIALIAKGHHPFTPHLSYWLEKRAIRTGVGKYTHEWWMEHDKYWVGVCDALFFIAPSPGANLERGWALDWGMPVYTCLEDVPSIAAPLSHHDRL
jgi:hypothetical protein